ncbi:Protein of unknown function [Halobacillus dabanensis]|uniref:Inner membrane protein YgaP-like transmembrane domain-containing protein n=1 Tax=Halobacillus dabanensis TaxID=240302 RepID=A0A1I3U2W2_HALDA|nr:DUF2892 domain-containing protein [Halobacillus dabanensis]SFJ77073.1 Protein of unknown function [Halobacillus dabanensis]
MKPNIGIVNSMIRITAGLSMLTYLTIRGARHENSSSHPLLIILSALKVAEGIVRFCPLTAVYEDMAAETDGIEESWQQDIPHNQ